MRLKYVDYDEYKKKVFKEQPEIKELFEKLNFKYKLINVLIECIRRCSIFRKEKEQE